MGDENQVTTENSESAVAPLPMSSSSDSIPQHEHGEEQVRVGVRGSHTDGDSSLRYHRCYPKWKGRPVYHGNEEALGWALDSVGRSVAFIGAGAFLSTALIHLARLSAGCDDPGGIGNSTADDPNSPGAEEDCSERRVYGIRPGSLLTTYTIVVGIVSSAVLPLVGAIVDYTSHRRLLGRYTSFLFCLFLFPQIFLLNERTWFAVAVLQILVAFFGWIQTMVTYAYLPELTNNEPRLAKYTQSFTVLSFSAMVVYLAAIVGIATAAGFAEDSVLTAQIGMAVAFAISSITLYLSWGRLLKKRPPSRDLPSDRSLWSAGFIQVYHSCIKIYRHYRALKWFYISVAFVDAAINALATIAITYLTDTLGFNAQENGIAVLLMLIGSIPGAFAAGYTIRLFNPIRSSILGTTILMINTIMAAVFLQSPGQQIETYILAFVWGIGTGWKWTTDRLLASAIIPEGQDAELMGVYLFAGQILTWLPPLIFTLLNESGISQRIGIGTLAIYFSVGIIALLLMGSYESAISQAGRMRLGDEGGNGEDASSVRVESTNGAENARSSSDHQVSTVDPQIHGPTAGHDGSFADITGCCTSTPRSSGKDVSPSRSMQSGRLKKRILFGVLLLHPSVAFSPIVSRNVIAHHPALHTSSVEDDQGGSIVDELLCKYGYNTRSISLRKTDECAVAEVYVGGETHIARVVDIHPTQGKLTVLFRDNREQTVDIGQITTVWQGMNMPKDISLAIPLSPEAVEGAMNRLYQTRVGRSRSSSSGLSKKTLMKLCAEFSLTEEQQIVLRSVLKAGKGLSRVVDSLDAESVLFPDIHPLRSSEDEASLRYIAAKVLSDDATRGGRFKRWPCAVLKASSQTMTLVNGGWLVLDQSVRASTEARKFVNRMSDETVRNLKTGNQDSSRASFNSADERIFRRLECLAMGEKREEGVGSRDRLELDVREALRALNLPFSSDGARQALIQTGRWTGKENFRVEPWSKDVLEAAVWYSDIRRKGSLTSNDNSRVDLTKYPCVCIDARRTTFRDDAIGLRPRADTNRRVDLMASKWEVLVHITDVSDIYLTVETPPDGVDTLNAHLSALRNAARGRGISRYDLPFGPLHLFPPKALEAMSFSKDADGQPAVTLWAYIDERDGRIIDAGLERTLISAPIQLAFGKATSLMESVSIDSGDAQLRALLLIAERNLSRWNLRQRQVSEAARKRETRLKRRENLTAALGNSRDHRDILPDDGTGGFQLSRSHRLVDYALDLYGSTLSALIRKEGAPMPVAIGADTSRGGRVATAPLRRYIDGEMQRQAVAVLCKTGKKLTMSECKEIGRKANASRNSVSNYRSIKRH